MPFTKKNKMRKKVRTTLVVINIIVILATVCAGFIYVQNLHSRREESTKNSFSTLVSSMRRVGGGVLLAQQQSCDDWAAYIDSHEMTVQEALDFLNATNTVDGVMGQILDYDTMKGYTSVPDSSGSYEVDYTDFKEGFRLIVEQIREDKGSIRITRAYNNPVNGNEVLGFCTNVELTTGEDRILMRVVPMDIISERWVFPAEYQDAEISLINANRDFVIHSASLPGKNFLEFINTYNFDGNSSDIEDILFDDDVKLTELYNSDNELCYFVTIPMTSKENWYYVGYIPKDSIFSAYYDFTLVIIISVGFLLLIALNSAYLISVNHQLRDSAEETRRANMAKTQFLSSMSHDIRTPMNAIIGITALSSKHTDDPQYIRESLRKITLASNHLLTLINDILDISKVESGKLTLNPTIFSIADSVTNLVNIVRTQIKEKEQNFNIRVKNINYEYIFADELRLNQIFINLLTNAVKYTHAGGTINLELREELADEEGKNVMLTYIVSDNGIGMTEEFQKTMYQSFSRAIDNRINTIQGSGLGLAITKEMVDLMNGSIECESRLGEGTTFTVKIVLPIGEKITEDLMLPPMKMLVVDDDGQFLDSAKDTLTSLGVTADTAADGETAIKMVTEMHDHGTDYPVVIVDWKMPGMDGIDTIKAIRSLVGDEISIIVVSAYDWSDIKEEALEAGANGFINKPFFRTAVYTTLTDIIQLQGQEKSVVLPDSFNSDMSGLHLLIAEDNDLNWEIIHEILEGFNITAERAENGSICVEMMKEHSDFDAIFMDIQMPEMNGREAARAIRSLSDKEKNSIPIIAMTADAFAEDVQACIEAGMNGHVAKPVDINKMLEELRKAGLSGKKRSG